MSRALLDRPYRADHAASMARKAKPPKNLLGWLMAEFRAELPEDIHWAGVWRDYTTDKGPGDPGPGGGGSLLGAPRYADEFRRYLEDSPFATEIAEYEGQRDRVPHYKFPLRAALAELAGRGKATDEYPFMARVLYRTALRDGDWDGACASFGILAPIRRVYIEAALYRLWCRYSVEPPAEWQQRGVA